MFGFIKRTMKPFKNIFVLKVLYNAYIRSCLDYCSSVWSPNSKCWINKLERVQRKFVKHLCFLSGTDYCASRYEQLCCHFQLRPLEQRRKISDLVLFHKILHGKVNCSYLLSCIYFNLPSRRTRHSTVLSAKKNARLQLRKHDFFPRTIAWVNTIAELDIFDLKATKSDISCALGS